MKITDLAIVFSLILIVSISVLYLEDEKADDYIKDMVMKNNTIDNIIIGSLNAGYEDNVGGKPIINRESAVNYLKNALDIMKVEMNMKLSDIKIIIFTDEDGFYIDNITNVGENNKIVYPAEINHQKKVEMIVNEMEKVISNKDYGINTTINMDIPFNDGEDWKQTISAYSMLILYAGKKEHILNNDYFEFFVSGAKIVDNTKT